MTLPDLKLPALPLSGRNEVVTRFAPSPNGWLHPGHAYSALVGFQAARQNGGRFLLRIEDIDRTRARPAYEQAIYDDLAWLGFDWEQPVRRQSDHFDDYRAALDRLETLGLLYPCFCTRKDITRAATRRGPEGPIYPGTCREIGAHERARALAAGRPHCRRLDVRKALAIIDRPLVWHEAGRGDVACQPALFGDVVLARKDVPTSYHLAVCLDDALQGVSLVTRGADLYQATHIHRLIQSILGLPAPLYHHHDLIPDTSGTRLAKSRNAPSIRQKRRAGIGRKALWDTVFHALNP
jgi:glutamyl-Q tRNA(Asp) synthetase